MPTGWVEDPRGCELVSMHGADGQVTCGMWSVGLEAPLWHPNLKDFPNAFGDMGCFSCLRECAEASFMLPAVKETASC